MIDNVLAWHFSGSQMRDGTPIVAPGSVERYDGDIEICASGLHASRMLRDALKYAPGTLLRRVECNNIEEEHGDKLVCRERIIIWECDMTSALRLFARKCALDVMHLWREPVPDIVQEFLMTGGRPMEAAMWAPTEAAARDATWVPAAFSAAREAAWSAARSVDNNVWAPSVASCAWRASECATWAHDAAMGVGTCGPVLDRQEVRLVAYAQAARAGAFL